MFSVVNKLTPHYVDRPWRSTWRKTTHSTITACHCKLQVLRKSFLIQCNVGEWFLWKPHYEPHYKTGCFEPGCCLDEQQSKPCCIGRHRHMPANSSIWKLSLRLHKNIMFMLRAVWLVALSCWRVMSCQPAGRVPHEGGGCLPCKHSIEISCNDNKLSTMMLWHTAPDYGPSTSKSIPLQSTGLGVTLIPLTMNANSTITPGETKPWLVSEEHFLPVLSGPATVGLCP